MNGFAFLHSVCIHKRWCNVCERRLLFVALVPDRIGCITDVSVWANVSNLSIKSKIFNCFFFLFVFLVKGIVHPKTKVLIYSHSCGSKPFFCMNIFILLLWNRAAWKFCYYYLLFSFAEESHSCLCEQFPLKGNCHSFRLLNPFYFFSFSLFIPDFSFSHLFSSVSGHPLKQCEWTHHRCVAESGVEQVAVQVSVLHVGKNDNRRWIAFTLHCLQTHTYHTNTAMTLISQSALLLLQGHF